MPQNAPMRKHEHHGGILLRKGFVAAAIRAEAAPPTPAPAWKLFENPSYQSFSAAAMASATSLMEFRQEEEKAAAEGVDDEADTPELEVSRREIGGFQGVQDHPAAGVSSMSVHKLAASLWDEFQEEGEGNSPVVLCNFLESSPCSHLQPRPSSLSNSESPDSVYHQTFSNMPTRRLRDSKCSLPLSYPSPSLKTSSLTLGSSIACKTAGYCSNPSQEDSLDEHGHCPDKNKKGNAGYSASLSDHTKASARICLESAQHDDSLNDLPFCEELRCALSRVEQVEAAQISARKEVDSLLRRCADEITLLRTKEQERIQAAVLPIADELNWERAARRTAEMESKKLSNSIADANRAVIAAEKELEKEHKARQLMEGVCNELAKEIAEDKAEVAELKKELAKVRGEVEEERKVLRITEAWREERVQMKLSEAKLELEERCIALDRLKVELESFLSKQLVNRAGRRGKSLKRAITRLQNDMSESAFFQGERKFQPSPTDDSLSPNISSLVPNIWNNNGHSSLTRWTYNRNHKKQAFHSTDSEESDSDWNGGIHRETCHSLEFTNAHPKQQRVPTLRQRSSRRRNVASMRSYQSKTNGLSHLGAMDYAEGTTNHSDKNRAGIYGSQRIRRDSASECMHSDQDESHQSNDVGDKGDAQTSLWSTNAAQQDPSTSEGEEVCNTKGRRGTGRNKQQHHEQDIAIAERHYRPSYKFSRRWDRMLNTDYDSELSSITGYLSACKGNMPSPDLPRKEPVHIRSPRNKIASLARRAVCSSVDWSKPYKENSLQAKLLQEDKLFR